MIIVLGVFVSLIFFILSGIHFNWTFGGTWGFDNALPTNVDEKRVLNPRKIESVIIALILAAFGVFYLANTDLISLEFPNWLNNFSSWLVPIIFLARFIGDFNYVGVFKKIKSTRFAKLDTKYYSPLCLIIALVTLVIKFA